MSEGADEAKGLSVGSMVGPVEPCRVALLDGLGFSFRAEKGHLKTFNNLYLEAKARFRP